MAIIKNAMQATSWALKYVGNPRYYEPITAHEELSLTGNRWIVKLRLGAIDRIVVTVEMPERLLAE